MSRASTPRSKVLAPSPEEAALMRLCREEKARGRRVLVYTIYTGTRDTTGRLKILLELAGFKAAVLRAQVETAVARTG